MHFTRLHLHGFKSFVDSTDLPIAEGLTGIVGPNGCGKSNLVEAVRWVMGETSPRRMRGAGMEDVIFAGTATRPSRNIAEVALHLDNTLHTATAEYNDSDDILVARKIERGGGSDYRINGRPVRQRDVQLLFADQSTGAGSTSVVGQGQIDALIRAKPQDRRQILEEASGTAGLQARRHEAELKLKAAEQNLTRVDDVLVTLDAQLRALRQQVRQASRYRNLAEHIRKTEAALLHLRWIEAEGATAQAREALQAAQSRANDLLAVVTKGAAEKTAIAAELPDLRAAEAAAAALVQKLTLAREHIDERAKTLDNEIKATESRLVQAQSDLLRETSRRSDGEIALARLTDEQRNLSEKIEALSDSLPQLDKSLEEATRESAALEAVLGEKTDAAAAARALKQALEREAEELIVRQAALTQRRADQDAQRTVFAAEIANAAERALAASMVEACEKELERRKEQTAQTQSARLSADEALAAARSAAAATESTLTKLRAESQTIEKMLARGDATHDQVIDLIAVAPGLEKALAVALGEALGASLDPSAAMHWRQTERLFAPPSLPAGAAPLEDVISAPPALARALSQIGLVESRQQGEEAAQSLKPGQILVSRDGWAWRWDGFTLSPEAQTSSALRLEQRNRLALLQEEIAQAENDHARAQESLSGAVALVQECGALDRQTNEALRAAFAALNDAREQYGKQEREIAAANAKLAATDEALRGIAQDMETVRERANALEEERAALPDLAALDVELARLRDASSGAREKRAGAQNDHANATRELETCEARLESLKEELSAWQARTHSAEKQGAELRERIDALTRELDFLRAQPAELDERRGTLMTELSSAEEKRRDAADLLIAAEQRLSVAEHQLKADEAALGDAREARVRAEAAVEAAVEHLDVLRERMREKLDCAPEKLRDIAALDDNGNLPSVFELEQLLGRHVRERDTMGPVNLRAELESQTTQNEIAKLTKEKEDLAAAIGKLRQGISQLNREARERLNNAFGQVNERFQKLFTSLFGGGRAYLELIDNEDPMNAGLEIFAAPPGKKQQILSLLSGGERTLTALALLFAVFQTNPSPICVLDEAEAALDESNITRFCDLVSEIGRETGTRFLIITHQRLTMAHMDRLFGVTMSEKGVSRLVSVDLAGAVALRDSKPNVAAENAENALKSVEAA